MTNAVISLADELTFGNHFASTLKPDALDRWYACRSGHKFQAFQGKQLVAFTTDNGTADVLNVYTCQDFKVGLRTGTASMWVDSSGREQWVGHAPLEIAPSCFLWHVQHTTIDFNQHRGRFNVKFNLAYRTLSNPMSPKERGNVYVLEYATFQHYYPRAIQTI
jgi:hypothetical protein